MDKFFKVLCLFIVLLMTLGMLYWLHFEISNLMLQEYEDVEFVKVIKSEKLSEIDKGYSVGTFVCEGEKYYLIEKEDNKFIVRATLTKVEKSSENILETYEAKVTELRGSKKNISNKKKDIPRNAYIIKYSDDIKDYGLYSKSQIMNIQEL